MFPSLISQRIGAFDAIRRGLAAAGAAVYYCKLLVVTRKAMSSAAFAKGMKCLPDMDIRTQWRLALEWKRNRRSKA
jgi:hypothetical protein